MKLGNGAFLAAVATGAGLALAFHALVTRSPPQVETGGQSTVQAAVPAPPQRDALVIPVRGVTADRLRDTYSDARGLGRRHDAIDIEAPRGTPVLSVAASAVLKLFRSDRGGITLYALAPDQRTIYYYAHLDRYADGMVEGRQLRAGEVIGYVGDSGNANRGDYHLHFEISITNDPGKYWGGAPVNPYPALKAGISVP